MDLSVFIIVLLAAFLHATWNTFVKADGDPLIFMAAMWMGSRLVAALFTPFVPFPPAEAWPYILLSVAIHQGYVAGLLLAYKYGELSHVYPLARGSGPLLVALLSVALIGETLSQTAMLAVFLIAVGIMSLAFTRGTQGLHNPLGVVFALLTGVFIAAYTITDGIGARLAGNPHSYSAWMFSLEWIPFVAYVFWKRGRETLPQLGAVWKKATFVGLLSVAAYWTVIWAMTVAPIALVAALRETSIIFAVLFGVLFLKERLSLMRVVATFTALIGVALLRFSRH